MADRNVEIAESGITGGDRRWGFPADLPEFCGPDELGRIIEDYWSWEDAGAIDGPDLAQINLRARGPLRGATVEQLFSFAYHASFLKNEGEYTRCNLFAAGSQEGGPRRVVQFTTPLKLIGPQTLRLLAPTLTSDAYALSIVPIDEGIGCDGIFLMNEGSADVEVPEVALRAFGHHGLSVAVLGPGEITVREGIFSARLRGNRLIDEASMIEVPMIQDWLHDCVSRQYARCRSEDPSGMEALRLAPWGEILWLWSRILSSARDLKHGGCFVIATNPASEYLDRKFATLEERLGDRLADYWLACAQAIKLKDRDGFAAAIQECNRTRHVLLAAVDLIASLSATDGCVVLDRDLALHGFGAVIQTPVSENGPSRTAIDARTGESLTLAELNMRGGTRHRSAFELCRWLPGTLAFVISQDGGISVLSSDDKNIYLGGSDGAL